MGQIQGKATLKSEIKQFQNLPRRTILDIWESFHDIAEGYGLNPQEFQDILHVSLFHHCSSGIALRNDNGDKHADFKSPSEHLQAQVSKATSDSRSGSGIDQRLAKEEKELNTTQFISKSNNNMYRSLFCIYDTDENLLVDSLEFLSSLSLISAMSKKHKLWYIFGIFDFDESGMLTLDEITLAFQATISGVLKILQKPNFEKPTDAQIDLLVSNAFSKIEQSEKKKIGSSYSTTCSINREDFVQYALNSSEISSWLDHLDTSSISRFTEYDSCIHKRNHPTSVTTSLDQNDCDITYPSLSSAYNPSDNNNSLIQKEDWRKAAIQSAPSEQPKEEKVEAIPTSTLNLDWIYGRNKQSRAFYSHTGDIIYSAGATVIKQQQQQQASNKHYQHKQSYFMGHSGKITALTVFLDSQDNTTIVASSALGIKPIIHVWSANTMEVISSLHGFHKVGVSFLDFSPSGHFLVSIGMDPMHSIAVYNWREKITIFTSFVSNNLVRDCRFLNSDYRIGICVAHPQFVQFWSSSSAHKSNTGTGYNYIPFECEHGVLFSPSTSKKQQKDIFMTCITGINRQKQPQLDDDDEFYTITGTDTGELYLWEGRTCIHIVKPEHSSYGASVTDIQVVLVNNHICVSYDDGKILMLAFHDTNKSFSYLSLLSTCDVFDTNSTFGGAHKSIYSVCWNPNANKMLVGLDESNELFEMSDIDGQIIRTVTHSHFSSSERIITQKARVISSISVNPNNNKGEIVTIGESDKSLRVWDILNHTMIHMIILYAIPKCVSYNHNGTKIAVGYGGTSTDNENNNKNDNNKNFSYNRKRGAFSILQNSEKSNSNTHYLSMIHEARDSTFSLLDCKFSQDGSKFAFCSQDSCIFIYNTFDYSLIGKTQTQIRPDNRINTMTHCIDFGYRLITVEEKGDNVIKKTKKELFIQSNINTSSDNNEQQQLLFWNIRGEQQTPTSMIDIQWETQTCLYSWPLLGLFDDDKRIKVKACCRSHYHSEKDFIIACVDNVGMIDLYSYPIQSSLIFRNEKNDTIVYSSDDNAKTKKKFLSFKSGHSASKVLFSFDNKWLFTVGGGSQDGDNCIFQWRHENDADVLEPLPMEINKSDNDESDHISFSSPYGLHNISSKDIDTKENSLSSKAWNSISNDLMDFEFAIEEEVEVTSQRQQKISGQKNETNDGNVVSMYAPPKPWQRTICAPSSSEEKEEEGSEPYHNNLVLEWIHGYNGVTCRNNVLYCYDIDSDKSTKYTTKKPIIYNVGKTVIVYDRNDETKQRFFQEAKDEITCLTVHHSKPLCAFGQKGQDHALIFIFDYEKKLKNNTKKSYKCFRVANHYRHAKNENSIMTNISALRFDPRNNGRYLIAAVTSSFIDKDEKDSDIQNRLIIYDFENETILASTTTTSCCSNTKKTYDLSWRSTNPEAAVDSFIECGSNFIRFWSLEPSSKNCLSYKAPYIGGGKDINLTQQQSISQTCFYSIGILDDKTSVVGTEDGCLYLFQGRRLDHIQKAHTSTISTIYSKHSSSSPSFVVTGSNDCFVKLWIKKKDNSLLEEEEQLLHLECIQSIDLQTFTNRNPMIRSVCCGFTSSYASNSISVEILVGTLGNEIWEFQSSSSSHTKDNPTLELDTFYPTTSTTKRQQQYTPLVQGHYDIYSFGLAVNPVIETQFMTVGDDQTLCIWSIGEEEEEAPIMYKAKELEMKSRACCYSPDGKMIAVGFGAPKQQQQTKKTYDGKWVIMAESDFSSIFATRDSKKYVTEMKWSSNGKTIAVGTCDCKIYVYEIMSQEQENDEANSMMIQVSLLSVMEQHKSTIQHFDFSSDNQYLQSNCAGYELCFFEVDTGLYIPAASRLKDVQWESQTCVYGWSVQGVWPLTNDGTNITSIDRFNNSNNNNNNHHDASYAGCLAVGDNYGRLQLYQYPCISPQKAIPKRYRSHLGEIAKVRWTFGNKHLITLGSSDQSIMIWRNNETQQEQQQQADVDAQYKQQQQQQQPAIEIDSYLTYEQNYNSIISNNSHTIGADEQSMLLTTKDQKKKLQRPWIALMVPPTKTTQNLNDDKVSPSVCPEEEEMRMQYDLELLHVYGFQNQFIRNGLFYNGQGQVVFPTANICVVHDTRKRKQSDSEKEGIKQNQIFFTNHQNPISCITTSTTSSPDILFSSSPFSLSTNHRRIFASAECSTVRPKIRLWDASTCREICVLQDFHRKGVVCMAFSSDMSRLVTVGAEHNHLVCVWKSNSKGEGGGAAEWNDTPILESWASGGLDRVFFVEFFISSSLSEKSMNSSHAFKIVGSRQKRQMNHFDFVTGGVNHVKFWRLEGPNLIPYRASFLNEATPQQAFLCGASMEEERRFLTGSLEGKIYVWKGEDGKLEKVIANSNEEETIINTSPICSIRTCYCNPGNISHATTKSRLRKTGRIVVGHQDGSIFILSFNFETLHKYHVGKNKNNNIGGISSAINSIDIWMNSTKTEIMKLLIGTKGSNIYEISVVTGNMILLHEGHCEGELWGLAMHPKNPDLFATCGDDQTIRIWSLKKNQTIRKLQLNNNEMDCDSSHFYCPMRSIAWSNDGNELLVGCGDGTRSTIDNNAGVGTNSKKKDGQVSFIKV